MTWSIWLAVVIVFLLAAWRVFSSKPDHTESNEEKLEREHERGLLTDDEYAKKKALLPH